MLRIEVAPPVTVTRWPSEPEAFQSMAWLIAEFDAVVSWPMLNQPEGNKPFGIRSLGRDGRPGGEGQDADISG